MFDFAGPTDAEMLSWLVSALGDEEAAVAAVEHADMVIGIDDPVACWSQLQALEADEARACAVALVARLRGETQVRELLFELLQDADFRRSLGQLVEDSRLEGADMTEVLQWARILHHGDDGAFGRLIAMRETGRK